MKIDYAKLLSRPEWQFNYLEIDSYFRNKRVVITGAGGTIGSAIAHKLAKGPGVAFLGLVGHSELPIFRLKNELGKYHFPHPEFSVTDIGSSAMGDLLLRWKPDLIIHAAAHKHVGLMELQPQAAFANNTLATQNLAHWAKATGEPEIVFISTDKAARPTSNMGASKRLAEAWLLTHYPKIKVCRFGNVLGSSGSLIEIAAKKIAEGAPLSITDASMKRFFITPAEAVGLVLQSTAFTDIQTPSLFSIRMGDEVKIVDVLERLGEQLAMPVNYEYYRPGDGEKLSEDLLNPGETEFNTRNDGIVQILFDLHEGVVDTAIRQVKQNVGDLKWAANNLYFPEGL